MAWEEVSGMGRQWNPGLLLVIVGLQIRIWVVARSFPAAAGVLNPLIIQSFGRLWSVRRRFAIRSGCTAKSRYSVRIVPEVLSIF
jgi:hypothetical protein